MSSSEYEIFKMRERAVTDLIGTVLEKNGKSIDDIRFDIRNVIYLCHKYDFDLPLMLAQMQCESHFGTTPRAIKTGSVISIGQWDNMTKTTYPDQDSCFEPYITIMIRDYLDAGNISVEKLLEPGNFVNKNGHRFASNPHYERDIRRTRNKIIMKYPELTNDIHCIVHNL